MDTIQEILLFTIIVIQLCTKAVILISKIHAFLYARELEQREREQAARDAKHHANHTRRQKISNLPPGQ